MERVTDGGSATGWREFEMSGFLQGQVWFRDVRGSERDVLLALADHADDDGTRIYPSMEYLAWKVGLTKRRTQQIVSSLRDRGVLIVVQEATRYEPTHYRMDLSQVPSKAPRPGVQSASPLAGRGEISGGSGVKSEATRGETQASPKPSREPSLEPSANKPRAREEPPDFTADYPDELKPVALTVRDVLQSVAEARPGSQIVKLGAVSRAIASFPHRDFVQVARDVEHWLLYGNGQRAQSKDVVARYRNFLRGSPEITGGSGQRGNGNVHPLRPGDAGPSATVGHASKFDGLTRWG